MVKFNASKKDCEKIKQIAERFSGIVLKVDPDHMVEMDLHAVHCNDTPLDLERMLRGHDFDLCHDVLGIHRHLDRTTGKLKHCFLPRFAKRKK